MHNFLNNLMKKSLKSSEKRKNENFLKDLISEKSEIFSPGK